MQLGNFSQTQQPDSASQHLLDTLQDIVSNVQIHSNFSISHPNYKPLELPDEVVARFQQMPADIQNKYLSLQLRSFIYGIYYNGSMRAVLAPDADSDGLALHQDLENNTRLGVDIAFYERLHSCNGGSGYFDPGWSVVRQEGDGTLAVTKNGLTLYIQPEKHLQLAEKSADVGDLVAIKLNYKNLFDYLIDAAICQKDDLDYLKIDVNSKTFHWVIDIPQKQEKLFVKQTPDYKSLERDVRISKEWMLYNFLQSHKDLDSASSLITEVLYFDDCNSILIYKGPNDCITLQSCYENQVTFPIELAELVGKTLAKLHSRYLLALLMEIGIEQMAMA